MPIVSSSFSVSTPCWWSVKEGPSDRRPRQEKLGERAPGATWILDPLSESDPRTANRLLGRAPWGQVTIVFPEGCFRWISGRQPAGPSRDHHEQRIDAHHRCPSRGNSRAHSSDIQVGSIRPLNHAGTFMITCPGEALSSRHTTGCGSILTNAMILLLRKKHAPIVLSQKTRNFS